MSALFDLGPHGGFIWAAYLAVTLAVTALFIWVVMDRRKQRQLLADLERRGVRRRSARASEPSKEAAGEEMRS